jgi:hypothetical protein
VPTIHDSENTKSFLPHNKNIVTFKDVQKVIESQPDYTTSQQSELLQRVRGKPFWIWDKANHRDKDRTYRGDCCFTDIIGRPRKNENGNRKPFWDYQRMLYWALFRPGYLNSSVSNNVLYPFKEKHWWCKKSTGLGVSEFFLRLMAWLCVRNDDYRNSQMVIVTGPNIDLAIKLIRE